MSGTDSEPPSRERDRLVFDDPLAQPNPDTADIGWGDESRDREGEAGDLDRFLREKPPHHL